MTKRFSVAQTVTAVALVSAALFSAACGASTPKGVAADHVGQLPKSLVSGSVLGLTAGRESIKRSLADQQGSSYVTDVGLYSLRKGDLLEATLQVSKLSSAARPKDKKFQEEVANQVGGTKVQAFDMGGRTVYRTSQRKQSITAWFVDDYFMVLAVRDTYDRPRALLRELLTKVNP